MAVADRDALQGAKPQQYADHVAVNNLDNITKPLKSGEVLAISDDITLEAAGYITNDESMDDLQHLLHLDKLIQPSPPTDITALQQETSQDKEIRLQVPEDESMMILLDNSKAVYRSSCEFSRHWLPVLPLRCRRDEGIEFPDHADRLQHLLLMKAENEALTLDEYCLELLQSEDNPDLLACDATSILPRELVELREASALNC